MPNASVYPATNSWSWLEFAPSECSMDGNATFTLEISNTVNAAAMEHTQKVRHLCETMESVAAVYVMTGQV